MKAYHTSALHPACSRPSLSSRDSLDSYDASESASASDSDDPPSRSSHLRSATESQEILHTPEKPPGRKSAAFLAHIPPPNPLIPRSFAAAIEEECTTLLRPSEPTSSRPERRLTAEEMQKHIASLAGESDSLRSLLALQFMQSDTPNPVVYSRYGKPCYGSTVFPYQSLDDFYEPNVMELKGLAERGSPFKAHQVAVCPGEKLSEKLPPAYYSPGPDDETLVFESRFEGGNLQLAVKREDGYDLLLQNDINTLGHTQWFYFRVRNTRKASHARFRMLNLAKPDSLYNAGMRVLYFSEQQHQLTKEGWTRGGEDISYKPNDYKRGSKTYFTLSFTHQFSHDHDTVYFAYCHPYGYFDLQRDLLKYQGSPLFSRAELCTTLAGKTVDVVTITSPETAKPREDVGPKKGVLVSARVHPGETNGSWMMRGVLDFLMSDADEAKALRERFVFKLVPMVNVDGVVHGNYRCSLAGCDLNRRYKRPSKFLHPEVSALKRLSKAFAKERHMALYCDLHGHSRRKNIFMYGNNTPLAPEQPRLFPFILSKLLSYFSFESSRFAVQRSKESTARISMWRELKLPAVYTMEASFCGADKGPLAGQHFSPQHLEQCGRKLCEALIVYCGVDVQRTLLRVGVSKKKLSDGEEEKDPLVRSYSGLKAKDLMKELLNNKASWSTQAPSEGSSGGSDDDPSADNLSAEEIVQLIPDKAKKKFEEDHKAAQMEALRIRAEEERAMKERQEEQRRMAEQAQRAKELKRSLQQRKDKKKKRAPMVDAWTQTSDRGEDSPSKGILKSGSVGLLTPKRDKKRELTPRNAPRLSMFSPTRADTPNALSNLPSTPNLRTQLSRVVYDDISSSPAGGVRKQEGLSFQKEERKRTAKSLLQRDEDFKRVQSTSLYGSSVDFRSKLTLKKYVSTASSNKTQNVKHSQELHHSEPRASHPLKRQATKASKQRAPGAVRVRKLGKKPREESSPRSYQL